MVDLTPFAIRHFPFLFKQNDVVVERPVLGGMDKLTSSNLLPSLNLAFFLEAEVAIFSDIVITLKQEVLRNGIEWQPVYDMKCTECGAEFQGEVEECYCKSTSFTEPVRAEVDLFTHPDGTSFVTRINRNGQSMLDVLDEFQSDLDIADNAYVIAVKKYDLSDEGDIKASVPIEFVNADPRTILRVMNERTGLPGNMKWVCIEHRDKVYDNPSARCESCSKKVHDVHYESSGLVDMKQYYIDGEVFYDILAYPSIRGGTPQCLKVLDEMWSFHYIEKRTKLHYEKGRPPGLLAFPTTNHNALVESWASVKLQLTEDPQAVPVMGFDTGQGRGVPQFIKFLEGQGTEMLEDKRDLVQRIGSRFGVSMIFLNDVSTSGGLNNEGLQITVTNKATKLRQSKQNTGVIPWMCAQFGIKSMVLQLNPSEERDEMAEKERFGKEAQNARAMLDLGYVPSLDSTGDSFTYDYDPEKAKEIRGGSDMFGGGSIEAPPSHSEIEPIDSSQTEQMDDLEVGVVTDITLNGAQISAAIEVLNSVRVGEVGKLAAIELLVAVGIPRESVKDMVKETELLPSPEEPETVVKKTRKSDDLDDLTEYQDDHLIKSFASDAMKAIEQGALYSYYADVADSAIPIIHNIIGEAFASNKLSLKDMIENITSKTNLDYEKARMIARTESTAVAMSAREIGWRDLEDKRGEKFKFKVVITNDHRTAGISKRIKAAIDAEGGSVTLDRMKAIYKRESQKPYVKGDPDRSGMGSDWTGWESFVAHPYERDSIVRDI